MPDSDIDLRAWIRPGDTVSWGQAGAEPLTLTRALVAQRHSFARARVFLGISLSDTLQPAHADALDFVGYTGSGSYRQLAQAGVLDILPCQYSQLPAFIRSGALQIDVLLLQVSPPDAQGRYSLGLAQDFLPAALDVARCVIGEVNPDVPWVAGERSLGKEDFDLLVPAACPPLDTPAAQPGPVERAIAARVAALIDDGATL